MNNQLTETDEEIQQNVDKFLSGLKYTSNEYKTRKEDLINPYNKHPNQVVAEEIGGTKNYAQYVAMNALNAYNNGALSDAEAAAILKMYR